MDQYLKFTQGTLQSAHHFGIKVKKKQQQQKKLCIQIDWER